MNFLKIGTWLFTHAAQLYTLVMTAVHTVEDAPKETVDKRQTAVTTLSNAVTSIWNLTGTLKTIVVDVLSGMVEVYVGVLNIVHGHDWYNTQPAPTKVNTAAVGAAPQVTGSPGQDAANAQKAAADNALTQATQAIRTADVTAPSPTPADKPK